MSNLSTIPAAAPARRRADVRLSFRIVNALLLVASCLFLTLHFVHLRADFPNGSPWMDWSKYTDEGWYGDAAIRHYQVGHWYVAGDFNPAVALPVWPLMEGLLFHFTGVSLAAARALSVTTFGLCLLLSYLLLRRWNSLTHASETLAPGIAVLLLAVSPFCYAFSRMSILEPPLILLTLAALLTTSYLDSPRGSSALGLRHLFSPRRSVTLLVLAVLLVLLVLTKTTSLFLFPAVMWLLFVRCGFRLHEFLWTSATVCSSAFLLWGAYFFLLVRPRLLGDYRYLFSANAYTGITPSNAISVLANTVSDGLWMGSLLYPLAVVCTFAALLAWERLRSNALLPSLLLWAAGYMCFLAYHDNLQPRYYLVIEVPLTLVVAIVVDGLCLAPLAASGRKRRGQRLAASLAALLLLTIACHDAQQTLAYVRSPQYTFLYAALKIRDIVSADPSHSRLLLSISGSDISLMTGLPSICDDFGTVELGDRVQRYRPGWYVAWNQVDDDKMDALAPLYHLQRIAEFPAMDDPERNLLILYRLDASATHETTRRPPRRIPRRLRTRIGQHPSAAQLEH